MSVQIEDMHSFQKVQTTILGRKICFCVNNRADWIQKHHYAGAFYEPEELGWMKQFFSRRTRYLDIGANVGNHIVYLCTFARPRETVAIEPNPPAIELLKLNLEHNDLVDMVDTSYLGQGLSDVESEGVLAVPRQNLGGARFVQTREEQACLDDDAGEQLVAQEGIKISVGDKVLADRDFDFVKIDVESMEMRVLKGMSALFGRCKPVLFIEVSDENAQAFDQWCQENKYRVSKRNRRYTTSENFLVVPRSRFG